MLPRDVGEAPDARWMSCPIAGSQFYDYGRRDGLGSRVHPRPGDRLQFIRQPDNAHDSNAIQIWFNQGQYMLGQTPAQEVARVARDIRG